MKSLRFGILAVVIVAVIVAFAMRGLPGRAQQSQPAGRQARTYDGKPNLNGIWQAMNTADWNLLAHASTAGRPDLGALGAAPPGLSVVEGNEIPYLPAAVAQRQQNLERRLTDDPL